MSENVCVYSGKIVKAATGRGECVLQGLKDLLCLARAEKDCVSYDLFRGSVWLNKNVIQDSIFFIKECWRSKESRDEFHKKDTLLEGEEYHVERTELSGRASGGSSGAVFSSVLVKASDNNRERLEHTLRGRVQGWGEVPGCLCCALYQGKGSANVFYAEQEWESPYAFNNARQDFFDTASDVSAEAEVYAMNMVSVPVPPITENAVLGDPQLIAGLRMLNKDFGELCVNASAVPWGKSLIDQKTKVFIALAIDVSEQITGKPFENHVAMARKQGVTRDELEELLLFMSIYAGFNKAGVFYSELDRIFGAKG